MIRGYFSFSRQIFHDRISEKGCEIFVFGLGKLARERHYFKPMSVIFLPVRRMNVFDGIHPVSRTEIKIAAAFRHAVPRRINLENNRFSRSAEQFESAFSESFSSQVGHNAEMLDIYKVFALPICLRRTNRLRISGRSYSFLSPLRRAELHPFFAHAPGTRLCKASSLRRIPAHPANIF